MAKRKIVWTQKAQAERKDILQYWIIRNKSKIFSVKLNNLILNTLQLLAEHPTIGRKTELLDVRVKIVRDYLILYEFSDTELIVLSIWDGRRLEQVKTL
ncbi:type II toxin-antitoxin system RelE/ParE family toxin [Chryseobacterium cheonjiense]|uniref:Type II toxin-antitoxin system RelE/ParE family toxin n=1 Tax=Chryseobacterium cheonjiense TaxID=2728845 RepID=A0A7Y0FK40_9FLAO|nr:type II toxin-antitoxin system RelE/ParE family toxin [Chryseobacterium cheonjiense]NML59213.1 type II toxin-antitoxin system RelE/ParE family toxin [Chryseobacterium cheonjiense]